MRSRYLVINDSLFRRFVRWLYTKTLDELSIPSGTTASVVRKPMVYGKEYGGISSIRLRTPVLGFPKRIGIMEEHVFDTEDDMYGVDYKIK